MSTIRHRLTALIHRHRATRAPSIDPRAAQALALLREEAELRARQAELEELRERLTGVTRGGRRLG